MKSSTFVFVPGSAGRSAIAITAFVLGSMACAKEAPPTGSAGESGSASQLAPLPAPLAPAAAASEPAATGFETLTGRLAHEARARPAVSPSAEEVLGALDDLGAKIPHRQQSLGETYKANYCLGGYTVDGLFALSACEYPDAAAAGAGRDLSKQILARMPTRDVWSHEAATLTIVQLRADAATSARRDRLVSAFLAM